MRLKILEVAKQKRGEYLLFSLFCCCFVLPFLNCLRFMPLQDWWTDALVVFGVGLAGLFIFGRGQQRFQLPASAIVLVLLLLLWSLSNNLLWKNFQAAALPIGSLLVMLLLVLFLANRVQLSKQTICTILAASILLGACLQVVLGGVQLLGLAANFHGLVMFSPDQPNVVMGNIAQRNLYAQYLCWGVVASCYLYAQGHLRAPFCGVAVVLMLLLVTWSGARLPLAYALAICLLAGFCWRLSARDGHMRRMVFALAAAMIALALIQIFSKEIVWFLDSIGLPIHAQSGSERMLDAGFGARRRVEWTKAWEVFLAHPWLGVGLGRYAAQSVWLEAFGGLPKFPESWLFTQCHNLIFQLLAETGLIGTLVAVLGLAWCLLPLLSRKGQGAESLMLACLGMMILTHSFFEFPLWYLPFLAMLVIVCTLSGAPIWQLQARTGVLRWTSVATGGLMIAHVISGGMIFWRLIEYNQPSLSSAENIQRADYLRKVGFDPLWATSANLVMGNYLLPSRQHLSIVLPYYEQMARDQPYVAVLLRLSLSRALAGQAQGARLALVQALANFPDEAPRIATTLSAWPDPEIDPLRRIADEASAAYQAHGAGTDAGRLAAVMTVASPVTRQPIF